MQQQEDKLTNVRVGTASWTDKTLIASKREGCNVTEPINGTNASSPAEISQRGWWDVVRRSSRAMAAQKMSLAAAGSAFYVMWAFFPALALIGVLATLLLGKAQVLALLSSVRLNLPTSFHIILVSQLDAIAQSSRGLSHDAPAPMPIDRIPSRV